MGISENPSQQVASSLGRPFQVLDVSYEAVDEFLEAFSVDAYDRLVMLGVAAGRTQLTPELFGTNFNGTSRDVHGQARFGQIELDAPLLVQSTLWSAENLAPLFPNPHLRVSYHAGAYLCNYITFRAIRSLPKVQVGFIHVPSVKAILLDDQVELVKKLVDVAERTP